MRPLSLRRTIADGDFASGGVNCEAINKVVREQSSHDFLKRKLVAGAGFEPAAFRL